MVDNFNIFAKNSKSNTGCGCIILSIVLFFAICGVTRLVDRFHLDWLWIVILFVLAFIFFRTLAASEKETVKEINEYDGDGFFPEGCLYTARILGKLSKLVNVEKSTAQLILEDFLNSYPLSDLDRALCKESYEQSKTGHESLHAILDELDRSTPIITKKRAPQFRMVLYDWCWKLCASAPRIPFAAVSALKEICDGMKLPDTVYDRYISLHRGKIDSIRDDSRTDDKSKHEDRREKRSDEPPKRPCPPESDSTAWAYERLHCCPEDSDETIRKAYKNEVLKWHPDRIHMDSDNPAVTEFLKKGISEVNNARDILKKAGRAI